MTATRLRRCPRLAGDDGAVIVEAAFVLPVLFALLLGFIEFSLVEFQQSQASSAARDGARVGILDYTSADVVGSATNVAVVAAVNARLAGQEGVAVVVRCRNGNDAPVACQPPTGLPTVADPAVLEVEVSWPYDDFTVFGAIVPSTITGTSRMVLVGAPVEVTVTTVPQSSTTTTSSTTSTTAPPATNCQLALSPAPTYSGAVVKSNGQLAQDLVISNVVTNGDVSCGTPQLRAYYTANGTQPPSTQETMAPTGGNSFTYTWQSNTKPSPNNEPGWTAGPVVFEVLTTSNIVIGQFTVPMVASREA
jgi:Flp pilus assembly protein TadG